MSVYDIKPVVVCADDYALNAPVSQGIVALAVLGRLSATSVMGLSPRWAEGAVALRDVRECLDVGVHLDWTSDFAKAAGHGASLNRVMARAALRGYAQQTLREQMHRQFDLFEAQWQAMPDHVDGHQHIQQFPCFREALAEVLLQRYGSAVRKPWVRISRVVQPGLKSRVISVMGSDAFERWAANASWPHLGPLLGAYDFGGTIETYAASMQEWLGQLPDNQTAVIMCHPAVSAQSDDAIGPARKREFAYLAGHDFVQHLVDAGARIVRGSGQAMMSA
jgi:predicted glycoside hydrolase/deacetylase ChbG (UPF0249 family)